MEVLFGAGEVDCSALSRHAYHFSRDVQGEEILLEQV